MATSVFAFGETRPGFDVPVLNEREVRAGAGVMFIGAMVAFHHAFLLGEYQLLRLFVVAFFLDFVIRVLVNPRFSPSLVLGRLAVSRQRPEFVGAPQKRFAWAIGLGLASLMLVLVVFLGVTGPFNLAICLLCLTLLFLESAFGICVGCFLYNALTKGKAKHCPGGACELRVKDPSQRVRWSEALSATALLAGLIAVHALGVLERG